MHDSNDSDVPISQNAERSKYIDTKILPPCLTAYVTLCIMLSYFIKDSILLLSLFFLTAGISSIQVSLLSVSDDLSTQHIEVNCFIFRVKPYQVIWRISSEIVTPDSTYLRMNGSELLNSVSQTYRHYISLNGSFSNGTIISCGTTVNDTEVEEYVLQGILHDTSTIKKLCCYLFHLLD